MPWFVGGLEKKTASGNGRRRWGMEVTGLEQIRGWGYQLLGSRSEGGTWAEDTM